MIYQIKVTLKDVGLPVWRRLLVHSDTTFEDLHYILMAAFDWAGYHLHEFDVRRSDGERMSVTRIGPDDGTNESGLENVFQFPVDDAFTSQFLPHLMSRNEKNERLSDWIKKEKDRVLYTYDFGDNWEHNIVLESILEADPSLTYPTCIKAKNEAPPEDSRGELIEGEIDLVNPDWKEIVADINDVFETDNWKDEFLSRDDLF